VVGDFPVLSAGPTPHTPLEAWSPSCGERHATGEHRAYLSAGVVLRCPTCGDLALRAAELADRVVVELRGTWTVHGAA
jgi:hypothetical protein